MGKHRNSAQEKIFVDFMEIHHDMARGYVKGDRVVADANWANLTEQLNSSGPPIKDCSGWKKTWADWKVFVKKKLCDNRKESEKTGGGPFNKYILSDIEESVARVGGLFRTVDGVAGGQKFGGKNLSIYLRQLDQENNDEIELDVTPSTSKNANSKNMVAVNNETLNSSSSASKRHISRSPSPDPKRNRARTPSNLKPDLNNLLKEENTHLKCIVQLMEDQRAVLKEHQQEMKMQNEKLDRLCDILEKHYKDRHLNDIETQKKLHERNQLKLKIIEIETLKLRIEKEKANRF